MNLRRRPSGGGGAAGLPGTSAPGIDRGTPLPTVALLEQLMLGSLWGVVAPADCASSPAPAAPLQSALWQGPAVPAACSRPPDAASRPPPPPCGGRRRSCDRFGARCPVRPVAPPRGRSASLGCPGCARGAPGKGVAAELLCGAEAARQHAALAACCGPAVLRGQGGCSRGAGGGRRGAF